MPSSLPRPQPAAARPRILIVDDSAVARAVIMRTIEADGRFEVVAATTHTNAALRVLHAQPVDVILLDLDLPGVDGLTALPDVIAAGKGAKVLVVSSSCDEGAASTVQALALGAADTLVKPGAGAPYARFAGLLCEKLARLGAGSSAEQSVALAPPPSPPRAARDAFDLVAIGASTGGIHALSQMLREIPASLRTPILITQHLPASFMPYFATQVAVIAGRPCDVAVDRLRLRPGRVTVAPGDAHVRCVNLADGSVALRLSNEPVASGCLPSVDPMFDSVAAAYGPRALGVVLSGMGRDGAEGARRIVEAGGGLVVQDQESSVVWGMPGAIASAGLAQAVLPPGAIGRLIATRRRPE